MGRYDILLGHDEPKPPEPAPQPQQSAVRPPAPVVPQRSERPNGRRIITRNSFEVFEDQMDSLRDRSYQEKRAGKIGSMSAMVREAIDAYLKKNT